MEEPTDTQTKQTVSREDYVKAASIIASCPDDRLPAVLKLLEKAGISFNEPEKTERTPTVREIDEKVLNLVFDFIQENQERFTGETDKEQYGFLADDGERVFVLPSVLYEELRKAGYSPRKTLKYLAEREVIAIHRYRDGKNCFTVKKYYNGSSRHHFVECIVHILRNNAVEQMVLELP